MWLGASSRTQESVSGHHLLIADGGGRGDGVVLHTIQNPRLRCLEGSATMLYIAGLPRFLIL